MKKMLSLLFLSSSLFSMQLALKMQTPRFDRVKSAVVKQQKAIALQANQVISKVVILQKYMSMHLQFVRHIAYLILSCIMVKKDLLFCMMIKSMLLKNVLWMKQHAVSPKKG